MREAGGFPKYLQIQTTTACGAKCKMCPHPKVSKSWPNGLMDDALFRSIIEQCRGQDVQRICPYLMAEPLTDPKIFERIAYIRSALPDVEIELSTTPQRLTPQAQTKLLAAPLTELRISSHGITAEDYKQLMPGVRFESAWRNLQAFIDKWRKQKPYPLYIVSLFGLLPAEREEAIAAYWQEQGIPLQRWRVTSRGRQVALEQFDSPEDPTDWRRARRLPPYVCRFGRDTEWMSILSDGRVTLCCMDYRQEVILGDLRAQSIAEVWTGPQFARLRRQIAGTAPGPDDMLCKRCEWYVSLSALERRTPRRAAVSSQTQPQEVAVR